MTTPESFAGIIITIGVIILAIYLIETYLPLLPKIWRAVIIATVILAIIRALHTWFCGWLCG
jgi:hypothetical protein